MQREIANVNKVVNIVRKHTKRLFSRAAPPPRINVASLSSDASYTASHNRPAPCAMQCAASTSPSLLCDFSGYSTSPLSSTCHPRPWSRCNVNHSNVRCSQPCWTQGSTVYIHMRQYLTNLGHTGIPQCSRPLCHAGVWLPCGDTFSVCCHPSLGGMMRRPNGITLSSYGTTLP